MTTSSAEAELDELVAAGDAEAAVDRLLDAARRSWIRSAFWRMSSSKFERISRTVKNPITSGEREQDREGEDRRRDRQPPADRQHVEAGDDPGAGHQGALST